jgi:hypothetical protein
MPDSPNGDRFEFHGVVLGFNSGRIQQEAEDLRIGLCSPPREEVEGKEHPNSPNEAIEQIENARAQNESKKE